MQNFFKLETCRTELYQWDVNQRIIILDDSITEVQYEIPSLNRSVTEVVFEEDGTRYCKIPRVLLEQPDDILVFAYVSSIDSGYTKVSSKIKMNERKVPTNYYYQF